MNDYHDKTNLQLIEEIESLKNRIDELEQSELKHNQAEQTIKTKEIKLRNIIEHSTNLFYSHTPDHLITYISPQTRKFFDCEPEEAKLRWTDFITENPGNEIGFILTNRAIKTSKIQPSYELEVVGKKGRRLWVEVNEAPVVEGGQTVAIVGTLTDITDRKLAEEELIESKQMLGDVLNTIPVRVFWKDLDGVYLGCNQIFARDAGRGNPEEVIGDNDYNMGWAEQAELYRSDDKFVTESGRAKIDYEEPQTTPEGKSIWLKTSKIPLLNSSGNIYGVLGTYEDITERKQAEEALQRSEAMFKGIFSQAPVGIELYDSDGSLINANQEALNIFGVGSVEDVKGFKLFEDPTISEEAKIQLRNGLPIDYESEFDFEFIKKLKLYKTTKSGKCFLQIQIVPYNISHNGERGFVVHVQNITERKQAEQALRDSEYLLSESQKVANLGHYELDILTGNWTSSKILDNIFGIDDNFIKKVEGWSDILHPSSREEMLTYFNESVLKQHQKFDKEYRIIRISNGEERWVHGLGELEFDGNGNPVKMIGTIQDITKQKRSEEALQKSTERYRSLYQNTPAMLHSIDREGRLTNVSEYWLKIMGYSIDEVLGRQSTDFMTDESSRYAKEVVLPKFYETGSCRDVSYQYVKKNGEVMDALLSAITENDENGELIYSLSVIIDVTDRRQAEASLKQSEARLRQVIDLVPHYIFAKDHKGRFILANSASAESMGTTPEEIIGKTELEIAPVKEEAQVFTMDDAAVISSGKPKFIPEGHFTDVERKSHILQTIKIPFTASGTQNPSVLGVSVDITERKQSEIALEASEEKYRELFEAESDALFLIDNETGNIIESNMAAEKLYGYTKKELAKKKNIDLSAESDKTKNITEKTSLNRENVIFIPLRYHKKRDGTNFPVEITGRFFNWKGKSVHIAAIRDITERKLAEVALSESEKKFREMADLSPLIVYEIDINRNLTFFNKRASAIFGFSKHDLMSNFNALDRVIPEDKDRAMENMKKIMNGKSASNTEYTLVKKDGSTFPVLIYSNRVMKDNKPVGLRGIIIDMTERKLAENKIKESQQRLSSHLDNTPLGSIFWDTDFKVIEWNSSAEKIFGFSKEEALGKHPKKLIVPKEIQGQIDDVFNHLLTQTGGTRSVNENVTKEGNRILCDWYNAAITDIDGKVTGVASLVDDITEQKETESKLKESRNHLRSLAERLQMIREEERATIAREIHDDLGQSLTALKMDISWLKNNQEKDTEFKPAKFDMMLDLTNSTIQTVKRIATELRPGILDDLGLVPAIEWQAAEFQNRFKIQCNFAINKSDVIIKDEISIAVFRIFQETLTNIARHSGATKVDVNLNFYDDNKLIMEITDNGVGIDEEQINSSKSLGLFGMRERVNILKGKMEIIGEHGKGTKVRVSIPFSKEDVGNNK